LEEQKLLSKSFIQKKNYYKIYLMNQPQ